MSEYKGIRGFKVQTLSTDPAASIAATGTWASATSVNTARRRGIGTGTQTAALFAGGYYTYANTELYNGSTWTEVNDLNQGRDQGGNNIGSQGSTLYVSGGGAPWPTILGNVEQWDGTNWTEIVEMNTARRNTFGAGIVTAAVIAGGYAPPTYSTLTETYNGTSWTEVNDLNTGGMYVGSLGTQTDGLCIARDTGPTYLGIVEHWNGTNWTEVGDLNTARAGPAGSGTSTSGLAFGGALFSGFTAVGNTEFYNGTSWTELADLGTSRANLNSSSTSSSASLAFGGYDGGSPGDSALTEEWTTTPAPTFSKENLGQVYYNSTSNAFKVTKSNSGIPLGTWASGGNLSTSSERLGGVGTQTAALSIAAVVVPNTVSGKTESYNGSAWTEVNDLNTTRYMGNFVFGTQTAAIAAGGTLTGPGVPTVANVEQWNGTSWTEVGDLNKAKAQGGGSGTTSGGLIFGGYYMPASPLYTILAETESWNGTSWTEVNDLNSSRYTNTSSKDNSQTAVITFGRANQSPATIVETWDGTNWTEVSDLNTGREGPGGAGSQTSTIAFGGQVPGGKTAATEFWNGSSWTEVNDLSTARSQLGGTGSSSAALGFGGLTPTTTNVTEEFTAPAPFATNVTITVS
jgi:hypothetical protein